MIIDFTVSNYRSIREAVTLSFVTQKGRGKSPDEEVCAGYAVSGRDFKLLPVIGLYGANASGKSNVLRALNEFLGLMGHGARNERELRNDFVPFKLDAATAGAPTEFEIRVALSTNIFTFQLSVCAGLILRERLEYSPLPGARQSVRLLYSRHWNEQSEKYVTKTGEYFSGAHNQLLNKVEKHEPYISLLHRLKVDVTEVFSEWLSVAAPGFFPGFEDIDQEFAAIWYHESPNTRRLTRKLIRLFDTGLADIATEETTGQDGEPSYRVWAVHNTPMGEVRWELDEESLGTQRLFGLTRAMIEAFHNGTPFIVDEFGSNFHPRITREIIRLFQSPETNPKGAQLIFTSHDNTLWRGGVLRRDEIWLTRKQADGSTRLFALSDYRVRTDMALDKAYMDGRFGAVPILDDIANAIASEREDQEQAAKVSG